MMDLLKRLGDCGLEFVSVPPGAYPMGFDGKREEAFAISHPNFDTKKIFLSPSRIHTVEKPYWIAKDPLRMSHFVALSKLYNLSDFVFDQEHELEADPALALSGIQAQALATIIGADLPQWYQWEAAARGPKGYLYPWGNEFKTSKLELEKFEYTLDADEEDEDDPASYYAEKEYYQTVSHLGPYADKESPMGLKGLCVPGREWNHGPAKDSSGKETLSLRSIFDLGAMAAEIPGLVPDTWGYSVENRYLAFSGPVLAQYCPEHFMVGHPKQLLWPKARIRLVLKD